MNLFQKKYNKVGRMLWVDSFKGIAIIGVFLVHCGTQIYSYPSIFRNLFSYGYLGVEIFYIINAFLLCKNYCNNKNASSPKILLHNILRILPLYYLRMPLLFNEYHWNISLPTAIVQFAFVGWLNPNWHFYNGWVFTIVFGWIYFLLVRKMLNSFSKTIIVCAVSIVLMEIFYIEAYTYMPPLGVDMEKLGIWTSQLKRTIASFSAGFVLYQIYHNFTVEVDNKEAFSKLSAYLLFTVGVALGGFLVVKRQTISNTHFNCIMIVVIISQFVYPLKLVVNKVFATIGKYSWGIYCFHLYIFGFCKNIFGVNGTKGIICLLLSFTVSFFIAVLLNLFIEYPFKRISDKLLQKIVM